MSALELTDDQVEAVHAEMAIGTAFTVFNLIRDMVLEAAATDCERRSKEWPASERTPFEVVCRGIRKMKGRA